MVKLRLRTSRQRRKLRVGKKIVGSASKPRVSVFRSNKYIYGQIIDDEANKTLVDVQAEAKKLHGKKNKTDASFEIGKVLATKAKEKKIKEVVFDRGAYKYHGRVKSFAEGLRKGGLKV